VLPIGAAVVAIGAFSFAAGDSNAVGVGRLLQGAGAVFAPVGAIYIATTYFPASQAATLIGPRKCLEWLEVPRANSRSGVPSMRASPGGLFGWEWELPV
jgi:hypothetical protein